ncbi:MAG TPA: hypothetical protein VNE63_12540 [Candidatus Acidoferrales bacterium]|nr:hypothetical protein [Candidatus Acidoferrales bacterium]
MKSDYWRLAYLDQVDEQLFDFTPLSVKASVARCARVSDQPYETGKLPTIAEDLKFHDRLVGRQPIQASAAEPQTIPGPWVGDGRRCGWLDEQQYGNFKGSRLYLEMYAGEALALLWDQWACRP